MGVNICGEHMNQMRQFTIPSYNNKTNIQSTLTHWMTKMDVVPCCWDHSMCGFYCCHQLKESFITFTILFCYWFTIVLNANNLSDIPGVCFMCWLINRGLCRDILENFAGFFANRKVCGHTFSEVMARFNITYPYLIIHLMSNEPYLAIINAFGSSSLWHWCYRPEFWYFHKCSLPFANVLVITADKLNMKGYEFSDAGYCENIVYC